MTRIFDYLKGVTGYLKIFLVGPFECKNLLKFTHQNSRTFNLLMIDAPIKGITFLLIHFMHSET